jgi:tungstate transport system ATP-binding protein
MLELRGVRHRYDGRVVLELEQFTVPQTAMIAVVGHNGAGKSTLLRLLALLEAPTEGQILFDGSVVTGRAPASLRRRVTLVEQRPILFRGTVLENLEYGLQIRGIGRTAVNGIIADLADRLGLGPLLARRRHQLSDGEVQRVAVARALALRPDVLLLDEPASSADRAAAGALYRALAAERAARPFAVCIASHQLEDAYRWADDIRALAEGRLSPVTPENLFRVELPPGEGVKLVRVGTVDIVVMTDRVGPAVLAVPPTDIFVSREPLPSSARNVLSGRVTGMAIERRGAGVHVRAEIGKGGIELVAAVTADAARDLGLAPGSSVVFSFKATAVQVF